MHYVYECIMNHTVIGIDDTDSQTLGMCTTYVGHLIVEELRSNGHTVDHAELIRLNPAAKHKTRGNASVAIHTSAPVDDALSTAKEIVFAESATEDPKTNPGIVVGTTSQIENEPFLDNYTLRAIRELFNLETITSFLEQSDLQSEFRGLGRGRIGALAAVSAYRSLTDWTYEYISYREPEAFGTERSVDIESVFEADKLEYPTVWDTVDYPTGSAICIPHTPCPILYGIRGDDSTAVKNVTQHINNETSPTAQLFKTNQGTDVHLQEGTTETATEDSSYTIQCTVTEESTRKEGGHAHFEVADQYGTLDVVAFSPTGDFRNFVDKLRTGDSIVICGEISDNTLKLEKFKVLSLNTVDIVNPTCPDCGKSMSSAGKNAGYRCRDCKNHQDTKDVIEVSRDLKTQWYEVPPTARRHIAKPLVRDPTEQSNTYRQSN